MLVRTDPFRDLDRIAAQVLGTKARPAVMPMDAWRDGDTFIVEFDLPAVDPESVDLDVERNVLTVRAERRPPTGPEIELIASERPRGMFSRQVILGDALDTDDIRASYQAGVLHLTIPVAERAKPRKIAIDSDAANAKPSPSDLQRNPSSRPVGDAHLDGSPGATAADRPDIPKKEGRDGRAFRRTERHSVGRHPGSAGRAAPGDRARRSQPRCHAPGGVPQAAPGGSHRARRRD